MDNVWSRQQEQITHTHRRRSVVGVNCDHKERERVMDEERMNTDESGRKDTMRKIK